MKNPSARAPRVLLLLAAVAPLAACFADERDGLDDRVPARPALEGEDDGDGDGVPSGSSPADGGTTDADEGKAEETLDLTATSRIAGPIGDDDGVVMGCTGPMAGGAAVLCVDDAAAGPGSGTAAAPYPTIGAAIAAAKSGDSIQIAEGTYAGNLTFGGVADNGGGGKALSLRGGFRSGDFGTRNARVHRTVLAGTGVALPVLRIYLASGSTVIDGLTVTGGRGLDAGYGNGVGGGLHLQNYGPGTITVSHVELTGNQTPTLGERQYGGGALAHNFGAGDIRFEDDHVHHNAAGKGAGLTLRGSRVTLLRNLVEDNTGHSDHGGGIYVSATTSTIARNVIRRNVTGATAGYGWGGGLIVTGGTATTLANVFTDNFAPSIGSAIFWDDDATGTMRGDFIYRNRCTNNGRSAIYVDGLDGTDATASNVLIENATIVGHACESWQTEGVIHVERRSRVTVRSSILWDNRRDFSTAYTGFTAATYSITATTAGTGNLIGTDPQFADLAANDFHLRSLAGRWNGSAWVSDPTTSPALDRGDPATQVGDEPIPHGGRVEMGAHGGTEEASKSLGSETCAAPAYVIAPGDTVSLVGTTTGTADDLHTCWEADPAFDGGEVVYQLALTEPGGTLQVVLDEPGVAASLVVRDGACGSEAGQYCWSSFDDREVGLLEPTTTSVYLVVDGLAASAGGYALTVSYDAASCGDGHVNTGEACDGGGPALGCTAACTLAPPDPAADRCGAGVPSFDVPPGGLILPTGTLLTTNGYGDDAIGSCAGSTGGSDQVLQLVPGLTGTMHVRIGHDATGPVWEQGLDDPRVWDEVLHARAGCEPETELACVDDLFASEELLVPVVAGVPFYLFIDGYDGGSYSRGPYELRIDYGP